jgi:hypothetical protein
MTLPCSVCPASVSMLALPSSAPRTHRRRTPPELVKVPTGQCTNLPILTMSAASAGFVAAAVGVLPAIDRTQSSAKPADLAAASAASIATQLCPLAARRLGRLKRPSRARSPRARIAARTARCTFRRANRQAERFGGSCARPRPSIRAVPRCHQCCTRLIG